MSKISLKLFLFKESCVHAMSSDEKGMNVCKLKLPARRTLHGRSDFLYLIFLSISYAMGRARVRSNSPEQQPSKLSFIKIMTSFIPPLYQRFSFPLLFLPIFLIGVTGNLLQDSFEGDSIGQFLSEQTAGYQFK